MSICVNNFCDASSDAQMIQKAIDAAKETGESVVVPRLNKRTGKFIWNIDKTLLLHENSMIVLEGCHLRLADGAVCNMFSNSYARTDKVLKKEFCQKNIHIIGMGGAVLDGGEHNKMYEDNGITRKVMKKSEHHITENCMLFFQNVSDITIENIKIRNQRYWGMYFYSASYGRVSNIHFETDGNVPNQDGVDLGKGTHDFIIENISGCTGDNAIALLATDDSIYCDELENKRDGDIRNVFIRNIKVYCVGGCALVRLLNHDGYRIYNIDIDGLIETSPWSENDAPLAQNPDLIINTDDEGNLLPVRKIITGEIGYRSEAAVIIGESYWYSRSKAEHGDTFGISVRNVMTHSRYAVFINNTLMDSHFENIRVFGNGHMAVYFGEGHVENVIFENVYFDKTAKPHKDDEHIYVEWNKTKSDGFAGVYFNTTKVDNLKFDNFEFCGQGLDSVFGGEADGDVIYSRFNNGELPLTIDDGVSVIEKN